MIEWMTKTTRGNTSGALVTLSEQKRPVRVRIGFTRDALDRITGGEENARIELGVDEEHGRLYFRKSADGYKITNERYSNFLNACGKSKVTKLRPFVGRRYELQEDCSFGVFIERVEDNG